MKQHSASFAPAKQPGLLARLFPPFGDRHLGMFYRQLATLLEAGVAIDRAVEVGGRGLGGLRGGRIVQRLVDGLRAGEQLHLLLRQFPHAFPSWHVQLIETGERTGRLPLVLRDLAEHCAERVARRRAMLTELAYPIVVVHAMFFLWRVPELFLGQIGFGTYMLSALGPLSILYAAAFGYYAAVRLGAFSPAVRYAAFTILHAVPVIGSVVKKITVSRFAMALRALYESGVDLEHALPAAGRASGNEVLAKAAEEASAAIATGSTLYDALAATHAFPARTLTMLATGEEAGRLDETLEKIEQSYSEEARHAVRLLSRAFTLAAYLLVALAVAVRVISFYMSYVNMLTHF